MTGLFRAIADTIAPPDLTCAVCGGERDVLRGFGVCRACAKTLRPLNETVCVAPNVEAISAFVYEENAAKLVHDLKYGAKGHAAYVLGAFMAARCEDFEAFGFRRRSRFHASAPLSFARVQPIGLSCAGGLVAAFSSRLRRALQDTQHAASNGIGRKKQK